MATPDETPTPEQMFISAALESAGTKEEPVSVTLSNELVMLLSEQLYNSPMKAIEELVVNSYDADARQCKLFVPKPSDLIAEGPRSFIAVFDDGLGMSYAGLVNLWQVGRSEKRDGRPFRRLQIGKFGIGKLATYTIANRVSYVTKRHDGILAVSIDFRQFEPAYGNHLEPLKLPVTRVADLSALAGIKRWSEALTAAGVSEADLQHPTWTTVLLEDLKPKAALIKGASLHWILSTAMPLRADFTVSLNGAPVESSKESFQKEVEFDIKDIKPKRLQELSKLTKEQFEIKKGGLVSPQFPEGITGTVFVVARSLQGKSDDLMRSNGFFVRVRGRLISEGDALFGLAPLSHQTFARFRADLNADDLDVILTAPREGVETSEKKLLFEAVLRTIFAEARERYNKVIEARALTNIHRPEGQRAFVPAELMEFPVADVLSSNVVAASGAEADRSWFYLTLPEHEELKTVAASLYSEPRRKYAFRYDPVGRNERLVKFSPAERVFQLNSEHPFVLAHGHDDSARRGLEDFVIAEVLLEVYLAEHGIPASVIGSVLQQRDSLLRALPSDHLFSLKSIAASLRDAAASERDLEMAMVVAARALGFVAAHISGPGKPDGIARFRDYPRGEQVIILEAKSATDVPRLGAIDFASLRRHMEREGAQGCLLLAPAYPGSTLGDDAAAAQIARTQRISCWTVEQLATVVEAVESKKISTNRVLDVVLSAFSPDDVKAALAKVFGDHRWKSTELYDALLLALRSLDGRLPGTVRNVSHLSSQLAADPRFEGIEEADIQQAVSELAAASKGSMELRRDSNIILLTSLEEIERRLGGMLGTQSTSRRVSELIDRRGG